jgi:multidrug efflux system membrane fusion protein
VPAAAVQRNAQGASVVYVVKQDTVTIRPITAGPTEGTSTAVLKGLDAGEMVVTDGVDRIREGAKVEVTQPGGGARAPGAGPPGGEAGKSGATHEDFKKKLEAMTPEQREEFKKRREERMKGGQ